MVHHEVTPSKLSPAAKQHTFRSDFVKRNRHLDNSQPELAQPELLLLCGW
jgi:hypothetical protein